MSRRAVAKIVQTFDRLHQRNEKITRLISQDSLVDSASTSADDKSSAAKNKSSKEIVSSLDEGLKELNAELTAQNKKIASQNLELHKQHHIMSLKVVALALNGVKVDYLLLDTLIVRPR